MKERTLNTNFASHVRCWLVNTLKLPGQWQMRKKRWGWCWGWGVSGGLEGNGKVIINHSPAGVPATIDVLPWGVRCPGIAVIPYGLRSQKHWRHHTHHLDQRLITVQATETSADFPPVTTITVPMTQTWSADFPPVTTITVPMTQTWSADFPPVTTITVPMTQTWSADFPPVTTITTNVISWFSTSDNNNCTNDTNLISWFSITDQKNCTTDRNIRNTWRFSLNSVERLKAKAIWIICCLLSVVQVSICIFAEGL